MPFVKGQIANPSGSNGRKPITDALCAVLSLGSSMPSPIPVPPDATIAHELATMLVNESRKGSLASLQEVINRVEGKAKESVDVNHNGSITHFAVDISPTLGFLADLTADGGDSAIQGVLPTGSLLPAPVRSGT